MYKELSMILHLVKEIPPNSKFTFNRFPRTKQANFTFDPKDEKNILLEFNDKKEKWKYPKWNQ